MLMKNIIAFLLALVICLSLCACGQTADTNTDTAPTTTVPVVTTTAPKTITAQPIQLGETITLDYVTVTLDVFEISDGYKFQYSEKSGNTTTTYNSVIPCPSGMKLICLKGTFTNMSQTEVYPSNNPIGGTMLINGFEYKTDMRCYTIKESKSLTGVPPMVEVKYLMYAAVPEALASSIETCQLYIGFVKDLDPAAWVDSTSDYDALYLLETMPAAQ